MFKRDASTVDVGRGSSDATGVASHSSRSFSTSVLAALRRGRTGSQRPSRTDISDLLEGGADLETAKSVSKLVSFAGCERLCRGVLLSTVMRSAGTLLASSQGSAATYELSSPVLEIEGFLSHNWSVPRRHKQLTLALHFNLDRTLAASTLVAVLGGMAAAFGWLPVVWDEAYGLPVSYLCRLLFPAVFLLLLLLAHELPGHLGSRDRMVFLDKVCIDQADPVVMQHGISKLGAFIRMSQRMVVIYTEQYLRKLWTVYEVAAFICLNDVSAMDVLSVEKAQLFLVGVAISFGMNVLNLLSTIYIGISWMVYVACLFPGIGYMMVVRRWAVQRANTAAMLRTFSVRDCTCSVAADRPVVYSNIAALMRVRHFVGRDADVEEALDAFNLKVRQMLPAAFATAFGRHCFGYKHYVAFGMISFFGTAMDYLSWASEGRPKLEVAVWAVHSVLWCFGMWPFIFVILEGGAVRCLQLRGWKLLLFGIAYTSIAAPPLVAVHLSLGILCDSAIESVPLFVFVVIIAVTVPMIAYSIIEGHCDWLLCRRRRAQASDLLKKPTPSQLQGSSGALPAVAAAVPAQDAGAASAADVGGAGAAGLAVLSAAEADAMQAADLCRACV